MIRLDSPPKAKAGSVPSMQVNSQSIDQHVLAVSSSLIQENSVPPKRKRGRPPKPNATPTSQGITGETTDVIQDSNAPPKRKRGRPRKPKALDDSTTVFPNGQSIDLPNGNSISDPPKRKRGRPRKPKAPDDSTTVFPDGQSIDLPDGNSISDPPKRKRGRPLKPKASDDSSTFFPNSQSVDLPNDNSISDPPKKKRGRPPKSKPVFSGSSEKVETCTLVTKSECQSNAVTPSEVIGTEESLKQATRVVEEIEKQTSSVSVDPLNSECKESKTKEKPAKKSHSKKRKPKAYKTKEEVHRLLERCGVNDPDKVCKCLKAGIMNGYVHLVPSDEDPSGVHGLDQVVAKGLCNVCSGKIKATLRQLLYQGDIGWDYEDGSPDAKVFCPNDCGGIYVGGFCNGKVHMDGGKFYNHCVECPKFGVCIYDYRNIHCITCGNHYFCSVFDKPSCPDCACSDSDDESIDAVVTPFLGLSALLGALHQ